MFCVASVAEIIVVACGCMCCDDSGYWSFVDVGDMFCVVVVACDCACCGDRKVVSHDDRETGDGVADV